MVPPHKSGDNWISTPWERAVRHGMQLALGVARKPQWLQQPRFLAANLLGGELADADHLVAVIGIGNHIDVLAKDVEEWEVIGREAAEAARSLILLVDRDLPLKALLAMGEH